MLDGITLNTKKIKNIQWFRSDKNFYFVHSLSAQCDEKNIIAKVDYDKKITAAVQKDNILGFQFHPEKVKEWDDSFKKLFIR